MKDLMTLVKECKQELDAADIYYSEHVDFTINHRAKKRWGLCRKDALGHYHIEISDRLLYDWISDKAVKTTIIHELLHTTPNGHGHKGSWKRGAELMNRLFDYNIQRCTSAAEKGVKTEPKILKAKYTIVCQECGTTWYRTRATAVTNRPENYHCHCGGSLLVNTL